MQQFAAPSTLAVPVVQSVPIVQAPLTAECQALAGRRIDAKCLTSTERIGCSLCGETYRVTVQGSQQPYLLRLLPYSEAAAEQAKALVSQLGPSQTQGRVAAYLDWFKYGELLGILIEYVEGSTLAQMIAAKQTAPLRPLLESGLQALQLIDSLGLAHGDIKPCNVVVRNGAAVLVDLALPAYSQQPGSCAHTSISTPRYTAPEALEAQINGLPLTLEQVQHADLWSLGLALWELATQQMPYDAVGKANTYAMMVTQPLQPAPSSVDPVLGQMLQLDAAARSTPDQLLAQLAALPVI